MFRESNAVSKSRRISITCYFVNLLDPGEDGHWLIDIDQNSLEIYFKYTSHLISRIVVAISIVRGEVSLSQGTPDKRL